MIAALTLLPALLGFIGPGSCRAASGPTWPRTGPHRRHRTTGASGPAGPTSSERRPVVPAVLALVLIVVLALPFFSLRLGSADQGNDPAGSTTRQAYDLLAKGSARASTGRSNSWRWSTTPADRAALDPGGGRRRHQPGVAKVGPTRLIPAHDGSRRRPDQRYPTTSPQDAATADLVNHLRQSDHPGRGLGTGPDRLRRRDHGHLHRLRPRAVGQAAPLHRPRGRCSRSCCWPWSSGASSSR